MAANIDEFEEHLGPGTTQTNGPADWKHEPMEGWTTDQWDEWIGRAPFMTMDEETNQMIQHYKKIKTTGGIFKYNVWEDGVRREVTKEFKLKSPEQIAEVEEKALEKVETQAFPTAEKLEDITEDLNLLRKDPGAYYTKRYEEEAIIKRNVQTAKVDEAAGVLDGIKHKFDGIEIKNEYTEKAQLPNTVRIVQAPFASTFAGEPTIGEEGTITTYPYQDKLKDATNLISEKFQIDASEASIKYPDQIKELAIQLWVEGEMDRDMNYDQEEYLKNLEYQQNDWVQDLINLSNPAALDPKNIALIRLKAEIAGENISQEQQDNLYQVIGEITAESDFSNFKKELQQNYITKQRGEEKKVSEEVSKYQLNMGLAKNNANTLKYYQNLVNGAGSDEYPEILNYNKITGVPQVDLIEDGVLPRHAGVEFNYVTGKMNLSLTEDDVNIYNQALDNFNTHARLADIALKNAGDYNVEASSYAQIGDHVKRTMNRLDITNNIIKQRALTFGAGLGSFMLNHLNDGVLDRKQLLDLTGLDINKEEDLATLDPITRQIIEGVTGLNDKVKVNLQWMRDKAGEINGYTKKRQELGDIRNFWDGLEWFGEATTEQAFNTALTLSTGGTGLVLMGLSEAGNEMNRMDLLEGTRVWDSETGKHKTIHYSPLQYYGSAYVHGAGEIVSELPLLSNLKMVKRHFKKATIALDSKYVVHNMPKKYGMDAVRKWGKGSATEGAGEVFAGLSGNAAKRWILGEDIALTEGLGEQFVTGFAVSAGGVNAPVLFDGLITAFSTKDETAGLRKRQGEIHDLRKRIETLESFPEQSTDVKLAISKLQGQIDTKFKASFDDIMAKGERVDELDNNDKSELIKAHSNTHRARVEIDKINQNPNLTNYEKIEIIKPMAQEINDLDARRNMIISNSTLRADNFRETKLQNQKIVTDGLTNDLKTIVVDDAVGAKIQAETIIDQAVIKESIIENYRENEAAKIVAVNNNITVEEAKKKKSEVAAVKESSNISTEQAVKALKQNAKDVLKQGLNKYETGVSGFMFGAENGIPISVAYKSNVGQRGGNATVLSHERGHAGLFRKIIDNNPEAIKLVSELETYVKKRYKKAYEMFGKVEEVYTEQEGDSQAVIAEEKLASLTDFMRKNNIKADRTLQGKLLGTMDKLKGTDQTGSFQEIKTGEDVFNLLTSFVSSYEKGEMSGLAASVLKGETKVAGVVEEGVVPEVAKETKAPKEKVTKEVAEPVFSKKEQIAFSKSIKDETPERKEDRHDRRNARSKEIFDQYAKGKTKAEWKAFLQTPKGQEIRNELVEMSYPDMIGIARNRGESEPMAAAQSGIIPLIQYIEAMDPMLQEEATHPIAAYIGDKLGYKVGTGIKQMAKKTPTISIEQEGVRQVVERQTTEDQTKKEKPIRKGIVVSQRLGKDADKSIDKIKSKITTKALTGAKEIGPITKQEQVEYLQKQTYKSLKDLVIEETQKMFGIKPKPGNLTKQDVKNAQMFIAKNPDLFYALLPEQHTTKTVNVGTKANPEYIVRPDKATGVQNVLLEAFYNKGTRKDNLTPWTKKPASDIKTSEFLDLFGVTEKGNPNLYKKSDNISSRIKALVEQTGRLITNQTVRQNIPGATRVAEGKARVMFSEALDDGKTTTRDVQNLATSFNKLSSKEQIIFRGGIDTFLSALGANQNVDWAFDTAYGNFLNKGKTETPTGKRINIINAWKVVMKYRKKGIFDLDTKKPKEERIEEYLYKAFDEQTNIEVYQKLIGLDKRSIDFTDNDQITSFVGSVNEFLGRKFQENPDWNDKQKVEYVLNKLAPLLAASAKVGNGSLTWTQNIDGVWELTETGKSSTKRSSVFANKGQIIDVLVKPLLENPDDVVWKLGEADAKGKRRGKVLYKGETVTTPRVSQSVNKYIEEQIQTGKLSNKALNDSAEYAKENEDTFFEMVNFYKEEIQKSESEITKNDLGMFLVASNGDMTSTLRAAANVDSIAYDENHLKDFNKEYKAAKTAKAKDRVFKNYWRYEHNPPARVMLVYTAQYVNGEITESQLREKFKDYTVTIIPKIMDEVINVRYKDTIPAFGNKWKRYYNNFSFGEFPFSTTVYTKQADGTYKTNIYGKYMADAYETVQEAQSTNLSNLEKSGVFESRPLENQELIEEARIMDQALNIARDPNAPIKKIRVFDFDDTLARTKSNVLYTMPDGTKGKLTAEEFAKKGDQLLEEGAEFDFSEFEKVMKGKKGPLFKVAEMIADKRGTQDIFVLTARPQAAAPAIKEFLDKLGLNIPIENITGLANSSPLAKSGWIVNKAAEGYNDFYFADDHTGNVRAVKKVLNVIDVKSKVQQAKIHFSKNVDEVFNTIIEQKTGIAREKQYSAAKAQTEGASKGKFKFFIPPSAEDFTGLLYRLLGKGKLGDAQMAWFKEHLLNPFGRAMNDLSNDRVRVMNDFRALKKILVKSKSIPKNLRKKAIGKFTQEDIARVIAWDQQGIEVEGLSKRDLAEFKKFVTDNPGLQTFVDQLIGINKGDGYAYPGKNWLAGSITMDLIEGLDTKRAKYLQQWQENVDLIFSEKNLNKIEAAFGTKYREALEDVLRRMKTGKNRKSAGNRIENRLLDYVNNSVGTVMFLNMRSGLLQLISSINFMNWTFNNPMKAGVAFANQPQYWKDFMTLMNSDFLVDRRNGLRINVTESEIADAARGEKNKPKAIINLLLKKGFIITQIADSFAIASGGATFYRNRINDLIKKGMSEENAKYQAFQEFRETAEESQQSARPDRISMQQASGAGRIILAFANTPMQYNRIIKKATQDLINGRGDYKSNLSKIVYYSMIQNVIFNALQQALFAFAVDDEEEEEQKKKYYTIANGMLDSLLRGIGISGQVVLTAKKLTQDVYMRYQKSIDPNAKWYEKRPEYEKSVWKALEFSPPLSIKIRKLRQAATNWEYNKWRHDKDPWSLEDPAWLSMAYVISATTNIPLDRLILKAENVGTVLEADQEWWRRVALFSGYKEWELESSKDRAERIDIEKTKRKEVKESKKKSYSTTTFKQAKKAKLIDLNKDQQVKRLKDLGLSTAEIRALNTEEKRVEEIVKRESKENREKYYISPEEKEIKRLTDSLTGLNKAAQVEQLLKDGKSKKEIRDLKYEKDRVGAILDKMLK